MCTDHKNYSPRRVQGAVMCSILSLHKQSHATECNRWQDRLDFEYAERLLLSMLDGEEDPHALPYVDENGIWKERMIDSENVPHLYVNHDIIIHTGDCIRWGGVLEGGVISITNTHIIVETSSGVCWYFLHSHKLEVEEVPIVEGGHAAPPDYLLEKVSGGTPHCKSGITPDHKGIERIP